MNFTIKDIKCDQLPFKKRGQSPPLFVKLIADGPDGQQKERTNPASMQRHSSASWPGPFSFTATSLELQLYRHHKFPRFAEGSFALSRDEHLGSAKVTVSEFLKEGASAFIDEPLHKSDKPGGPNATSTRIKFSIASLSKDAAVEVIQREEAIARADHGISAMQTGPSAADNMETMFDGSASAADVVISFADTWDLLLDKIKLFVDIVDDLGEIHPYAKIACSVLTVVPRAVIEQRTRDSSLCGLMETIKDIHSFLLEAGPLETIKSHRKTFKEMEKLTMAGAHLIRDYTLHSVVRSHASGHGHGQRSRNRQ